jgi:hypothetical protein
MGKDLPSPQGSLYMLCKHLHELNGQAKANQLGGMAAGNPLMRDVLLFRHQLLLRKKALALARLPRFVNRIRSVGDGVEHQP